MFFSSDIGHVFSLLLNALFQPVFSLISFAGARECLPVRPDPPPPLDPPTHTG